MIAVAFAAVLQCSNRCPKSWAYPCRFDYTTGQRLRLENAVYLCFQDISCVNFPRRHTQNRVCMWKRNAAWLVDMGIWSLSALSFFFFFIVCMKVQEVSLSPTYYFEKSLKPLNKFFLNYLDSKYQYILCWLCYCFTWMNKRNRKTSLTLALSYIMFILRCIHVSHLRICKRFNHLLALRWPSLLSMCIQLFTFTVLLYRAL